jgi:TPR repeat protein
MKKLFTALSLILATAVWAGDFEDGDAAYKKGDYKTAFSFFKKAAAQGDSYAQALLASINVSDYPKNFSHKLPLKQASTAVWSKACLLESKVL